MIIGIATLIMMLFGAGSVEVFYLDKIELGVNKQITDKDRKKELQAELEEYKKAAKVFYKKRKGLLKELKKQNLDNNTSPQWYQDFFNSRMIERKKQEALYIDQRILLQQKITADEWANIMKIAQDEASKLAEKEQKKERKKNDDNIFRNLEKAVNEEISDETKRARVLAKLLEYEKEYNAIVADYDAINIQEVDFLEDRNASKEQMHKLADALNKQRTKMYDGYMDFIMTMNKNTTEEEWKPIIKEFNKVLY